MIVYTVNLQEGGLIWQVLYFECTGPKNSWSSYYFKPLFCSVAVLFVKRVVFSNLRPVCAIVLICHCRPLVLLFVKSCLSFHFTHFKMRVLSSICEVMDLCLFNLFQQYVTTGKNY